MQFFSRSGLDRPMLKQIWSQANLRGGAGLNKKEFFIAMRLVSLAQSGNAVTREAVAATMAQPLPPPRFEGIAPPQAAPAAATGPYAIGPEDQKKYDQIFMMQDSDRDGYLEGQQAVALLSQSGLDRGVLRTIWSLADIDCDKRLDHDEFCIAMHLVVGASKRGLPVPTTLPPELIPASKAHLVPSPRTAAQNGMAAVPATAPPPAPAPAPPVQFQQQSIGDAFGGLDVDLPPPPPPAMATAPPPAPAPVPVPVAAPVQVPAHQHRGSFTAAPSGAAAMPAFAAVAVPAAMPAPYAVPMPAAAMPAAAVTSLPTAAAPASSSSPVKVDDGSMKPLVAIASDLEGHMSSHLRREHTALDHRRQLSESAESELKRLESERAILSKQVQIIKSQIAEEDSSFSAIVSKIQAVRSEIAAAKQAEAQAQQALTESRGRTSEAKGALAGLATQLLALTGKADHLSSDVKQLLESALGQELQASQLHTSAAQLSSVTAAHSAHADANQEETAALREATAAIERRIAALQAERSQIEARLGAGSAAVASAQASLRQAEQQLQSEKDRHEAR